MGHFSASVILALIFVDAQDTRTVQASGTAIAMRTVDHERIVKLNVGFRGKCHRQFMAGSLLPASN